MRLDCMLILLQGQSVVSWQLPQAEVCVYHYILKGSRYTTTANYNKYHLKNDSDWNWLCAPNFKCYHLILTIIAAVTAKFCQMLSFHRAKSLVYIQVWEDWRRGDTYQYISIKLDSRQSAGDTAGKGGWWGWPAQCCLHPQWQELHHGVGHCLIGNTVYS